jgi:hypothetical protein
MQKQQVTKLLKKLYWCLRAPFDSDIQLEQEKKHEEFRLLKIYCLRTTDRASGENAEEVSDQVAAH